jgi:ubiquinone/menaquinone biosynthesis C-methylase UbiE
MANIAAQTEYTAKEKYVSSIADEYVRKRASSPTWHWEQAQVDRWCKTRPAGSSVLDVPFGTGRYVPEYRAAGLLVKGADISADMISAAERELGAVFRECEVVVSDAERLTHFGDGSVDAVLSSRFIQWLPDLDTVERVLKEFARVAKSELLLQVKIPAGATRTGRERSPMRERMSRLTKMTPAAVADRILKRLRRDPSLDWKIYIYREADLLERAARAGWRLMEIGEECPNAPGLRFYRLTKA